MNNQTKKINSVIGNVITLLTFKKPFPMFKENHLFVHHPPKLLATDSDIENTPYIINELGFERGQPIEFYPQHLIEVLISPFFYSKKIVNRVKNLLQAPLYYRFVILGLFLAIVSILAFTHTWIVFLIWFVPCLLAGYVAELMQQIVEHDWGYKPKSNSSAKTLILGKSFAIYLGTHVPKSSVFQKPLLWIWWTLQLMVNSLLRITIFPLCLLAHCYHHANSTDRDWANQSYNLRKFQSGKSYWHKPFREVWGLKAALKLVFTSLGNQSK